MNKISIALGLAALLLVGCTEKEEKQDIQKIESTQETKSGKAPQNIYGTSTEKEIDTAHSNVNTQVTTQNVQHIGKVLETVDGAGYTYAKVEEGANIYWIAGPKTSIKPGNTISFIEQMVMENFTSKSLNRTFDHLLFASTIIPRDSSGQAVSTMQKDDNCDSCDTHKKIEPLHPTTSEIKTTETVKVLKNKNGYSVEELYSKSPELNAKSVNVNAKVVKVSKNIMGKDWIHLQDGTGAAGTNDIIATAVNSTVSVGDIVTASGVLKTNVDLGYGYKFSAIIEETKFSALN